MHQQKRLNYWPSYRSGVIAFTMLTSLLCSSFVHAQVDSSSQWCVSVSPHAGFIVPHNKSITHLIQGHSTGIHVYAFHAVDGSKYWHYAYNRPEQGVDFTFTNTGNPQQLGQQYAASYLLNLPLNRRPVGNQDFEISHSGYRHWLGLGIGLGYATKYWDLETNHQAAVLGSHVNVALSLQYSMRIAIFRSSELRAGIRLTHFSNGAYQLPNLGTNNAGLFLSYAMGRSKHLELNPFPEPSRERYRISMGVVSGLKEIPPPTGRKYAAFVLSCLAERRVSYKSAFGFGVDWFYDSSLRPLVQQRTREVVGPASVMQLGVVMSYSLFFDRFSLKMQQGYYLADAFRLNGSLYHRVGLRYDVGANFYAQLTLKTHFAKADYGELGIGYLLKR